MIGRIGAAGPCGERRLSGGNPSGPGILPRVFRAGIGQGTGTDGAMGNSQFRSRWGFDESDVFLFTHGDIQGESILWGGKQSHGVLCELL